MRLDTFIYYVTAPIRLFGRSRRFRLAVVAACIIATCYAATMWALNRFIPADSGLPEALAILQPPKALQPVTRASQVIAPVAVALTAIGNSLNVVVVGSHNTTVVDSSQINNGNQTATAQLNSH